MFGIARFNNVARSPSLAFLSAHSLINTTGTTFAITNGSIAIGDIIVYFVSANNNTTSAAPATLVTPAGYNLVYNLATPTQAVAQRCAVFWHKTTAAGSRTLSTFTGTQGSSHIAYVYRPNFNVSTVTFDTGTTQQTISAPTNQTLSFTNMTNTSVAFAFGAASNGTSDTSTLTVTRTPSRSTSAIFTSNTYARLSVYEGSQWAPGASSTISRSDAGTNVLISSRFTAS